jgi:hypothetical protein
VGAEPKEQGDDLMVPRKFVAALVSLLALGVFTSAASADPLTMTFTEARANVGKQLEDEALFAAPDTAPFSAQIDPLTGAISNGTLGVPDFETHIEEPIVADVTVDFDIGQITGSFDQASGALSLTGEAGGTLTATETDPAFEGQECKVLAEPSPITLTTSGSSGGTTPRTGTPFTSGLTGPGTIAGGWDDMSAEPVEPSVTKNVNFCNDVATQIGGPGGIWLKQNGVVTPPQQPPTNNPPPHSDPPPQPPTCVVPSLTGKKLGRARATLRKANCGVGKVSKPKHEKGKRRGGLVVKSSNPAAGTSLAAGSKVSLNLGHQHHKPRPL